MSKKRAPARRLRQSERTELSDQRMIDTAIRILLRQGISGLRMTEVGLQAGYSRGLAAMRFGTVGGLLRRVARHLTERWLEAVNEAVGDKKGLAAIHAVIDAQERLLAPPASAYHVQFLILSHSMDPGTVDRIHANRVLAAQHRDLARWIREGIRAGEVRGDIEPAAEAQSILGSMIGITYRSLMDPAVRPARPSAKLKGEIEARLRAR
ncbi:MAG TPA: hypothetical protein VHZ53_11370 [Steroidobacteraceae bacterium]|jgi:AcrR family transcriptional regulator|nr:hypothetical protein [Steroidobacteraceae bacterium]